MSEQKREVCTMLSYGENYDIVKCGKAICYKSAECVKLKLHVAGLSYRE